MPLVHWFRKELKSGIGHILLESRSMARGYFNPRECASVARGALERDVATIPGLFGFC